MKVFATLIFVPLFLTACGGEKGPSPVATASVDEPSTKAEVEAGIPAYDARTFFMTTSYLAVGSSGYAFSADGSRVLVSSDESGVFNARAFDLETSISEALTESLDEAVFAVSYFPADDRLLYTFDEGGNELNHVYVREIAGESRDLTTGESIKAYFMHWSADGLPIGVQLVGRPGDEATLIRVAAQLENAQPWIDRRPPVCCWP